MALWVVLGVAFAQTPAAEQAADAAVRTWLAGGFTTKIDPEDPWKALRQTLNFQPAPRDGRVNVALREFGTAEGNTETYRYPVADRAGNLLTYDVTVTRGTDGTWTPTRIMPEAAQASLPESLKSPLATVVFALLSVAFVVAAFTNTFIREGLRRALAIARETLPVYGVINALLYGVFALGMAFGVSFPEAARELGNLLGGSLRQTGILDFASNVPSLALGIFTWNFMSGAFLTTYVPGLFLGVPAPLFNLARFFAIGVALAPTEGLGASFWLHLPVIIIELQAYIFIACAAVGWLFRWPRVGFVRAWRDYAYSLLPAALLLLIGAWYEALEILVLVPMFR